MARRKRLPDPSGNAPENYPPMQPVTVHYCVKTALDQARKITGYTLQDGLQVAKGTAILRNTVIRGWIDRYGVDTAVRLAGLRSADSLRLSADKPETQAQRRELTETEAA